MLKKTILFSGYDCDPAEVSEALTAFIWLNILLKKFNIILLTTHTAKDSINRYYNSNNSFPANLQIISFADEYPFKSNRIIRNSLKLGYFYFNYKIKAYLKKHPGIIERCDLVFQKSPESFRYYTSLIYFKKPVYIGPLSGGLKPPVQLKGYFKKEPFLFKLRYLDPLILKLPVYKRQFDKIKKVIISFDYLEDILPAKFLQRKKVLLNSGIHCAEFPQAVNDQSTTTIIFIGRLTRFKGAELLIKALNNIRSANFILHILGQGEERTKLESLVKEFGLAEKIIFHGFVSPQQAKQFYQSASIFCLPTLTESVGVVFFEAMASGLPIITINNGGPKYICPDEGAIKIPITSEAGIITSLQESISFLINNPGKGIEMGSFNRKYCFENYDWAILEARILNFFNDELRDL